MPLGKPTDDGDIVPGSRHYTGTPHPLGAVATWNCPACGKQNDGQKIENGCLHCGAGDQRQGRAGAQAGAAAATRSAPVTGSPPPGAGVEPSRRPYVEEMGRDPHEPMRARKEAGERILRLVEYLITPGHDADLTLRNSLVGRMDFAWGSLTATIVDSCDARQEDLLRLARRQPGVWVGNQDAMNQARPTAQQPFVAEEGRATRLFPAYLHHELQEQKEQMEMPQTGPPFTTGDQALAERIVLLGGLKLAYTLALALQTIAEELVGNMEPEKFLTREEALALANALMSQVPEGWNPQPEEGTGEEQPNGSAT